VCSSSSGSLHPSLFHCPWAWKRGNKSKSVDAGVTRKWAQEINSGLIEMNSSKICGLRTCEILDKFALRGLKYIMFYIYICYMCYICMYVYMLYKCFGNHVLTIKHIYLSPQVYRFLFENLKGGNHSEALQHYKWILKCDGFV
jgi:hypothetical protein